MWNLQTLFDVTERLDASVFVRFVDHSTSLHLRDAMDEVADPSGSIKTKSSHRK